jgi:ribosomal protein L6P/L9E
MEREVCFHKLKFKFSTKNSLLHLNWENRTSLNFFDDGRRQSIAVRFREDVAFSDHISLVPLNFITNNLFFLKKNRLFIVSLNLFGRLFRSLLKGLNQKFFVEYRVVGLGYKVFKSKRETAFKTVKLRLGFSHVINFKIPNNVHFFIGKRRFIVSTNDLETLQDICLHLKLLKEPNPYKLKGLVSVKNEVNLKQGKQQQR